MVENWTKQPAVGRTQLLAVERTQQLEQTTVVVVQGVDVGVGAPQFSLRLREQVRGQGLRRTTPKKSTCVLDQ